MEERHDYKGLILWGQLIGGNDVGQAGRQVALIQWHTLQAMAAMKAEKMSVAAGMLSQQV